MLCNFPHWKIDVVLRAFTVFIMTGEAVGIAFKQKSIDS